MVRISIVGLFLLASMYTLYLGRALAVAVLAAVFINYLLSPVVRALAKRRIPRGVSALMLLVGLTLGIAATTAAIAVPAASWLAKAPRALEKAQEGLQSMRLRVRKATAVASTLEKVTQIEEPKPQVTISRPSLGARVFGSTTSLVGALLTVLLLSFFLLAPGDMFTAKLVEVLPTRQDKATALRISREIEQQVSRYIITVTAINAALGVATALLMWGLGMPNPLLWGVLAGVLNFVPYIGGLLTIGIIALVSLASFDTMSQALLPPAAFFLLNLVESNYVTPKVLEHWLELNAVVGFVGVLLFFTLFGVAGALLAVPILVVFKILCDHVESLKPCAGFLGK